MKSAIVLVTGDGKPSLGLTERSGSYQGGDAPRHFFIKGELRENIKCVY